MSLRFTPPKLMGRYALFVDWENNNGFFKVYNNLGAVKGAARHHTLHWGRTTQHAAKILEMIDGAWWVLYDIPKGTEVFPWYKDVEVWSGSYSGGYNTVKKARPLTADEYAEFRVKVAREQAGLVSA